MKCKFPMKLKYVCIIVFISSLILAQNNFDKLLESIQTKPDTNKIKELTDWAWVNRSKNPKEALRSTQEAVNISKKINNIKFEAKALNLMGVIYRNLGQYDKSIVVYKDALRLAEKAKDSVQIAYSNNNIGGIYRLEGNNTLALEYILEALKIFESINHKEGMSFCTINIGLINRRQGNYPMALEYLNRTIELRKETNDKPGIALALNLIAEIYFEMGKLDIALKYYTDVEKKYYEVDDKKGIAAVWGGIAGVYFSEKKYDNALEFRKKALELSQRISYLEGQATNHSRIGLIYALKGNFQEAEMNFAKALEIAESFNEIYVKQDCYNYLSQYYEIKKDYKNSLYYNRKLSALKDSVSKKQNIDLVTQIEAIYKKEKLEKQSSLLQKDLELKQKQNTYLIVIAVLVIFIAGVIYNRYRSKKNANEKLEVLNSEKDMLLKLIAHDLKTPFNAIFGYTEILREDFNDLSDEEKLTFVKNIEEASKQNFQLLENLLLWSQSHTGKLQFKLEKIQLSKLISQNINLLERSASNKRVSLNVYVQDDLFIYADENMINAVLRNLMANAIKFTNPTGSVSISVENKNKYVEISVVDTGVGIDDSIKQLLFSIDYVNTRKGTAGERGTGFGLILCREFVEKHSGKIWVESELGKGSKFVFTLPQNSGNQA